MRLSLLLPLATAVLAEEASDNHWPPFDSEFEGAVFAPPPAVPRPFFGPPKGLPGPPPWALGGWGWGKEDDESDEADAIPAAIPFGVGSALPPPKGAASAPPAAPGSPPAPDAPPATPATPPAGDAPATPPAPKDGPAPPSPPGPPKGPFGPKGPRPYLGPPGYGAAPPKGPGYAGPPGGYGPRGPAYGGIPGQRPYPGPPGGYGPEGPAYGAKPPGYAGPPGGYGPQGPSYGQKPPGYAGPPGGYGPQGPSYGQKPPGYAGPPGGYGPQGPAYGQKPPGYAGGSGPGYGPGPAAPAIPVTPAQLPKGAEGFKLAQGSTGGPLTFAIALPNSEGSDDFIGQLSGKGIGWGAVSIGDGMLNKILVGVQLPQSGPQGGLFFTNHYGIPAPLAKSGINITTIPSETWAKASDWKYTFLCSGCLSLNKEEEGFGGKGGQAEFGFAYAAKDKTFTHKHESQGRNLIDLKAAKTEGFAAFAKGGA